MTATSTFTIAKFPMGPHVRKWLSIDESAYLGHQNSAPSTQDIVNFSEFVLEKLSEITPKNSDQLVDIMEELVGMNLPLLAIKLVDANPRLFPENDFRAQLHLGNAAMLVSDLARAENAFSFAQKLVPEEPAPYVNLTQIYCHDDMLDLAHQWCIAGLNIDQDNVRLWEMLAWIEQERASSKEDKIQIGAKAVKALADKLNSWAGSSLYVDLVAPEDVLQKLSSLERFWNEGNRNAEFLIEYTAVLGMSGNYDRIPSIVWQFEKDQEKQSDKALAPWQLYLHLVQSYMGLGRDEDAKAALKKLSQFKNLPESGFQAIASIEAELSPMQILN